MNLQTIITRVKSGDIPKNLEEKVSLIKTIEAVVILETSLIAQILSTARIEDFKDNEPKWSAWVTEKFGYSKERRCNLNAVGKMLIGMRESYPEYYERLFPLDGEKNIRIAALYKRESGKKIADFLKAYHVEQMSREAVRDAVNECLGIKKINPFKVNQPELPGFRDSIVNIYNNLGKINTGKLIESYDPETAKKTVSVGMTCLNAVSGYYKKSGEYHNLSVEELNNLEAQANKLFKQFGTWREEVANKHLKAG